MESMREQEPQVLIRSGCINAEGPVWDDETQTFYFIDVEAGRIFSWKDGILQTWEAGEKVGCAVLTEDGGMLAGLHSGIYRVHFPDGGKELLCDPEADLPDNRFNDGKVTPDGRFYAGTLTMAPTDAPMASLYLICPGGAGRKTTWQRVIGDVGLANGITFSRDRKQFYFVDTDRRTITAYRYHAPDGTLHDPKVVAQVPEEMGSPDGMTIDENGHLWVALWGGGAVTCWDPADGTLLRRISLPVCNVSSVCFGGPQMDTLFITTASQDTDLTAYPLAGNVFTFRPGVRGEKSYKARIL